MDLRLGPFELDPLCDCDMVSVVDRLECGRIRTRDYEKLKGK